MRKLHWLSLGSLVATLVVSLGWVEPVCSQRPVDKPVAKPAPATKPAQGGAKGPQVQAGTGDKSAKEKEPVDPNSLRGRIITESKLPAKDVDKVLKALGPAITEMLQSGQQVQVEGLGTFRVVHVPAHRDLVDGRPATIPGRNYVEFIPSGDLNAAANSGGADPTEVVPPFRYNVLPNQVPGMRTGTTRMPRQKTR